MSEAGSPPADPGWFSWAGYPRPWAIGIPVTPLAYVTKSDVCVMPNSNRWAWLETPISSAGNERKLDVSNALMMLVRYTNSCAAGTGVDVDS